MRTLTVSALALAALVLLASFTLPGKDGGQAVPTIDTYQMTIDGAAIPIGPARTPTEASCGPAIAARAAAETMKSRPKLPSVIWRL